MLRTGLVERGDLNDALAALSDQFSAEQIDQFTELERPDCRTHAHALPSGSTAIVRARLVLHRYLSPSAFSTLSVISMRGLR